MYKSYLKGLHTRDVRGCRKQERTEEEAESISAWMCPLMSRLQPASPGPATGRRSECQSVGRSACGWWWHVAILLTSLSPDHLSVLTCERASRQLTGKHHFSLYLETFFFPISSNDISKIWPSHLRSLKRVYYRFWKVYERFSYFLVPAKMIIFYCVAYVIWRGQVKFISTFSWLIKNAKLGHTVK